MNTIPVASDAILQTLVTGDLSKLSNDEKLGYYKRVCESLGLNPLTKPFAYIKLNGKETLYATRDCTDQIRKVHKVSIKITAREHINGVYVVTAQASLPDGRCDESTGAVTTDRLSGDGLANAYLKCETKAKRRVTLSICGLGLLDETEIETIKDARQVAPPEIIRMPIKTMADVKEEHSRELQSSLKDDMKRMSSNQPLKKNDFVKQAFSAPAGVKETPTGGEYVSTVGQPGGKIHGKKIKDIVKKDLEDFMKYLRSKDAPQSYLMQNDVQEFIANAEDYINDLLQIEREKSD